MKISVNTNWLLLLVLIFVGQTLAVPLTNFDDCEMDHSVSINSDDSVSSHNMSSMSDHDMSTMDMSSGMDCCDDCECYDGLYLSTIYFSLLNNNVAFFASNSVVFDASQFIKTHRSSSIYRPPIIS